MTTWQAVIATRQMHDPVRGLPLLEEARVRWAALAPKEHPIFGHVQRARAAFASMQGELGLAEREQRAAIAHFNAAGVLPVDLATARAELAAIRADRGDKAEARALLLQVMPILRDAMLPQENTRAAAEALAKKLGV